MSARYESRRQSFPDAAKQTLQAQLREVLRPLLGEDFDDPVTRRIAKRDIVMALRWIVPGESATSKPPRVGTARRLLSDVENASRALRRLLPEFGALVELEWNLPSHSEVTKQLRWADDVRAAQILPREHSRDDQLHLSDTLLALERICETLKDRIDRDLPFSATIPMRWTTNPKLRLVLAAADLFANYRPMDLKGTTGGPFYDFCAALYELANAGEAEGQGVGLRRYVEFVAPRARRLSALARHREFLMIARPPHVFGARIAREIERLDTEMNSLRRDLETGPFGTPAKP